MQSILIIFREGQYHLQAAHSSFECLSGRHISEIVFLLYRHHKPSCLSLSRWMVFNKYIYWMHFFSLLHYIQCISWVGKIYVSVSEWTCFMQVLSPSFCFNPLRNVKPWITLKSRIFINMVVSMYEELYGIISIYKSIRTELFSSRVVNKIQVHTKISLLEIQSVHLGFEN